MYRLTLRNLRANKARFALTTFGLMLAVSFVVSAFVLADGLRSSFRDVSKDITAGIDLEVRNTTDFGDTPPLPADTVAAVAAVDGVADAVANIEAAENAVRPITPDGDTIATDGPPQLAFNWIDNDALSAFTLVDGAPPRVGEFVMDVDSAAEHGFVVGDTYELMVPGGRVQLRLSGTSSFGADNATLGAVLMQMHTDQASEIFGIGGITSVAVQLADGVDTVSMQAAIAAAVSPAEVVDHATVLEETTSDFTDEIDVVGNILLGFGGVAVFVSAFIVYNTFAIVLGQRTRELALLRTVGADPGQLRRSARGEALVMGVLASAGGVGGGIAVAKGIDALFGVMGVDLIEYPLILAHRTLVAAGVIGIGVTLLAARGPARRAAAVPPIAALRSGADARAARPRSRLAVGLALLGIGLLLVTADASAIGSTALTIAGLSSGAVATVLGVTVLSPLVVGTLMRLLGWPVRAFGGLAGRLAQRNAARNARQTATTAAALMIGLTLVSTALVVGASVKATIGSTFERSAKGDYYLTDDLDEVYFPAALVGEIRRSPAVAAATGFTPVEARVDGEVTGVTVLDFAQIDAVLDLDLRSGGFGRGARDTVVMSVDEARARGVDVGDVLPIEFSNGTHADLTVVGLFDDQAVLTDDYLVDTSVLVAAGLPADPEWIAVALADDASAGEVATLVTGLSKEFPHASVETASEFRNRLEGTVDKVLTMVNVIVALTVVIALIGIANTLALSVFERTRELGLLRAVGMTRRQLRRMVRLEAALVAVFGGVLGAGLGLVFGFGVVTALPASFASGVSVPAVPLATAVLLAAGAAMAAAWFPARRAGRLDVLDAIAA
jgi:putative ABC transport system permease protein